MAKKTVFAIGNEVYETSSRKTGIVSGIYRNWFEFAERSNSYLGDTVMDMERQLLENNSDAMNERWFSIITPEDHIIIAPEPCVQLINSNLN